MEPGHKVHLFRNGNTAVFNEHGAQVPEAQQSWLLLLAKHLSSLGIDPADCDWIMPDGGRCRIFKTPEGGYNWSIGQ